jgi:hypothetical protein
MEHLQQGVHGVYWRFAFLQVVMADGVVRCKRMQVSCTADSMFLWVYYSPRVIAGTVSLWEKYESFPVVGYASWRRPSKACLTTRDNKALLVLVNLVSTNAHQCPDLSWWRKMDGSTDGRCCLGSKETGIGLWAEWMMRGELRVCAGFHKNPPVFLDARTSEDANDTNLFTTASPNAAIASFAMMDVFDNAQLSALKLPLSAKSWGKMHGSRVWSGGRRYPALGVMYILYVVDMFPRSLVINNLLNPLQSPSKMAIIYSKALKLSQFKALHVLLVLTVDLCLSNYLALTWTVCCLITTP